jgi:hypothetical protein
MFINRLFILLAVAMLVLTACTSQATSAPISTTVQPTTKAAISSMTPTPITESTSENGIWSTGLPPNGKWTVNLTAEDVIAKGVLQSKATAWAGSIFFEFQDGQGKFRAEYLNGDISECAFTYQAVDDFFRITYSMADHDCANELDDLQWHLDGEGKLHFHVINIKGAPLIENKAGYEAKPWRKVE